MEAIEEIWNQVDDITDLPDDRRAFEIEALDRKIQSSIDRNNQSHPLLYLRAYLLANHPDARQNEDLSRTIIAAFEEAIGCGQNVGLSRLFLAHHLYDIGQVQRASLLLNRRELPVPEDPNLALKQEELVVCCLLRLGNFRLAIEKLRKYVSLCESLPKEFVFPTILSSLMKHFSSPLGVDVKKELKPLLSRLSELSEFPPL